jgi:hypothetical protein
MKLQQICILFLAAAPLLAQQTDGETRETPAVKAETSEGAAEKLKEMADALAAIEQKRKNGTVSMKEHPLSAACDELFRKSDTSGCLELLNQFEQQYQRDWISTHWRGIIAIVQKDYKEAEILCRSTVDLSVQAPASERFHTRFNLCEILFVKKNWKESSADFLLLLKDVEADESLATADTRALICFKLLITSRSLKSAALIAQTDAALEKHVTEREDQTAAQVYCKAAEAWLDGQKDEFRKLRAEARKRFDRATVALYEDSFLEFKWK